MLFGFKQQLGTTIYFNILIKLGLKNALKIEISIIKSVLKIKNSVLSTLLKSNCEYIHMCLKSETINMGNVVCLNSLF
jgi:hypothetical protein